MAVIIILFVNIQFFGLFIYAYCSFQKKYSVFHFFYYWLGKLYRYDVEKSEEQH